MGKHAVHNPAAKLLHDAPLPEQTSAWQQQHRCQPDSGHVRGVANGFGTVLRLRHLLWLAVHGISS